MSQKYETMKEKIIEEYTLKKEQYACYTEYVDHKIKKLLEEKKYKYQSIKSRTKSVESLNNKIVKEGSKLLDRIEGKLININDLSGIRIIIYDHNYSILSLFLGKYFNIVSEKETEDIRNYDGLNITITLKKSKKFSNMKCEIQITNVFAEAINEYCHDITYKDVNSLKEKDISTFDEITNNIYKMRKSYFDIMELYDSNRLLLDRSLSINEDIDYYYREGFANVYDRINSLDELSTELDRLYNIKDRINTQKMLDDIKNGNYITELIDAYEKIEKSIITHPLITDFPSHVFIKLLGVLCECSYIWYYDFENILVRLYNLKNENTNHYYYEFLKSICLVDGYCDEKKIYYNINAEIVKFIKNNNVPEEIKVYLAKEFCFNGLTINNKIINYQFIDPVFASNEDYHKDAVFAFEWILKKFCEKQNNEIFGYIESILHHGTTQINELFCKHIIDNYQFINLYYKYLIYENHVVDSNNMICLKKYMEKDNSLKLFCYIYEYNYRFDNRYINKKEKYLKIYKKRLNRSRLKDVINILKTIKENEYIFGDDIKSFDFLFEIGKCKKAKKILESVWNESIYLGYLDSSSTSIIIDDVEKAIRIINVLGLYNGSRYNDIVNSLIDYAKNNDDELLNIRLMDIYFKNEFNLHIIELNDYVINLIEKYTQKNVGVMNRVLPKVASFLIQNLEKNKLDIIIDNLVITKIDLYVNFFYNALFEKNPLLFRDTFKNNMSQIFEINRNNRYRFDKLNDTPCFHDERKDNFNLSIWCMNNFDSYAIYKFIKYFLGPYDNELECIIIDYLSNCKSANKCKKVLKMCEYYNLEFDCWKLYDYMISKFNDSGLNAEIMRILLKRGAAYGGQDAYENKYKNNMDIIKILLNNGTTSNISKKFLKELLRETQKMYNREKNNNIMLSSN